MRFAEVPSVKKGWYEKLVSSFCVAIWAHCLYRPSKICREMPRA